jgi:(p)ppGpp synthase/HD superfamily hydrolase
MLITKNTSDEDQLVIKAYHKAHEAHAGQVHAVNRIPFIAHPLEVLNYVSDWGVRDVDIRQAALLHEVTHPRSCKPVSLDEIEKEFGENVANIVRECTFVYEKPNLSATKDHHRQALKVFFKTFYETSVGSLIIAVADRLLIVNDLVRTSPPKAKPAFVVAKDLFAALKHRKSEITESCKEGIEIWSRMRYRLTQVSQMTA